MCLLCLVKGRHRESTGLVQHFIYSGEYTVHVLLVECNIGLSVFLIFVKQKVRQDFEDATVPATLPASIWEEEGHILVFVFLTW
jgi:hypothetical protein